MATNFPISLDAFTNPTAVDTLDSPPHDVQHADANDAIEALQTKVGVDGSAVTDSLDYKVANFTNKLGSGSGDTYPWAAGAELTAADLNAYAGLVYITSATATSGTVLDINNVFTSTFTSYRFVIDEHRTTAGTAYDLQLRIKAASPTSTGYYGGVTRVDIAANSSNVFSMNNTAQYNLSLIANSNGAASGWFDLHSPQLAKYTVINGQSSDNRNASGYGGISHSGQLANTTQYTGVRLFISGGAFANLSVRVYGYNNG